MIAGRVRMILLAALVALLCIPPAHATAQLPGGNASGAQYLPSVPAGGGNRQETEIAGGRDRPGRAGVKALGVSGDGASVGLLLPVLLLGSLIVTLVLVRRRG
jgi:hypothetical protein